MQTICTHNQVQVLSIPSRTYPACDHNGQNVFHAKQYFEILSAKDLTATR